MSLLTDEEIKLLGEGTSGTWQDDLQFARAIEASVIKKLSEQEREPVAWVCVNEDGECEQIDFGPDSPLPGDEGFKPLYLHPQPPEAKLLSQ